MWTAVPAGHLRGLSLYSRGWFHRSDRPRPQCACATSWGRGAPLTLRLDSHGAAWTLARVVTAAIFPSHGSLSGLFSDMGPACPRGTHVGWLG
eukprot:766298-Pyramimonas_sp.AAC.1